MVGESFDPRSGLPEERGETLSSQSPPAGLLPVAITGADGLGGRACCENTYRMPLTAAYAAVMPSAVASETVKVNMNATKSPFTESRLPESDLPL